MVIGIILGIILAIGAIACFIVMGCAFDDCNSTRGAVALILAVILTLVFIVVPFSFHTVRTGEVAVVKYLGKAKEVRTAGTYYDFWMLNKYDKYDAKVQNVEIDTMAYSSDAQTMSVQMILQYQIVSDEVVSIASQYGSLKRLENRIISISTEKAKSVLSSYKAMDIIANRAQMSPEVETAIMNAIGEEYFVNVVAVVLTNIDFSDAFELAVEEKMIAEQTKLKAAYENETKVAQVEAEAEAKLKAAQAEIDIAKAQAEAKKIAANGEAEANRIISESLTDDIITKILADAWNGELPKVVGSGDYILPTDMLQ